nr:MULTISPECIES: threonine/serine exporter family protein [unclassified Mycolicibacterium]
MSAAAMLIDNGQSTEMTATAVQRLDRGLGIDAVVEPTWSTLTLTAAGSRDILRMVRVNPTAVNMRRVGTLMAVIDRAEDGPLAVDEVEAAVRQAAELPVYGNAIFAAACVTGACALSVIFGATNPLVVLLVAVGAALGGVLRRWLGARGIGPLVQAFGAALVAGAVGGVAGHLGLGAAAGLVALCPAMVLVPGPHILNGTLDVLNLRIPLGLARLGFSGLLLAAIAGGLLLGLAAAGQTVAINAPTGSAPWYLDLIAAGVAAASYAAYWTVPWRMVVWPIGVGMAAHALHWWAANHGMGLAGSAFVACLLVGIVLSPVATRLRIPFAAIGFASVVALVPGVFAFRALSGFVQFSRAPSTELLTTILSDANQVVLTVAAMTLGLCIPKFVYLSVIGRSRK